MASRGGRKPAMARHADFCPLCGQARRRQVMRLRLVILLRAQEVLEVLAALRVEDWLQGRLGRSRLIVLSIGLLGLVLARSPGAVGDDRCHRGRCCPPLAREGACRCRVS